MNEKRISVLLLVEDSEIKKEISETISSIEGIQLKGPESEGPCDIFFMDVGKNPEKTFSLIRAMQSEGKTEHFFLTSRDADPQVLIQAIRLGISGFFPQPINREELKATILKIRNEKFKENINNTNPIKKGKIINILGTKGGIGTTTIAVNLAAELAALEGSPSIALVDMNLHFGEVPLFLGMEPVFDWLEVIKNISRLDRTYLMSILLKHQSGIYVLPAPVRVSDEYSINRQNIGDLFRAMQSIFDYVVVDSGQSLGSMAKVVIKMSDVLLLVTLLSLPCLINSKKLLNTIQHIGNLSEGSIKVVVNRFIAHSDITLKDGEKSMNLKIFHTIPNDYETTMRAINMGKPIRLMSNGSEISGKFEEMAHTISGKTERKRQGLFFRSKK